MRRAWKLLAAGLALCFLALAFRQEAVVGFLCPSTSLRYDEPLDRSQVEAARDYGVRNKGPGLTFWAERSAWVSCAAGGDMAIQQTFDGEADLACPTEYLHGRGPVSLEPETCAVSTGLAWSLWGGEDVVGLELTVEGVTCRVTGVFRDNRSRLLRPDISGFTAVELQNVPPGEDAYRFAEAYARSCGLGEPAEVLWGEGFAGLTRVLPWLPVILAAGFLAGYGFRRVWRLSAFWRSAWGVGAAFLLAAALPGLLERLPAWLVPTRWSDFDFWSRLGETLVNRCRDFLALTPQSRDVAVKLAMLKTFFASLGACVCSVWLKSLIIQSKSR